MMAHGGSVFISLVMSGAGHVFTHFHGHVHVFLEKCPFQSLAYFLISLFLSLNGKRFLYILDINPLLDIQLQVFSTIS